MKNQYSRYSVFTWLFHFLTLAFSSAVIIVVLTIAHEKMTRQIISSMNQELIQYADVTAKQVRNILTASTYQNFYNQEVTILRKDAGISNFDMILAFRVLNSFSSSNNFIKSVYVYNRKKKLYLFNKRRKFRLLRLFFR